jgi:hypothetical protein
MRLPRHDAMPAEIERELRALDAALAGEPVDPELGGLRDLALAVQSERPAPPEDLVRALDARVAARFPKQTAGRPSRPPRRRSLPLAFGTAGAIFVLVAVGLTSGLFAGGGGEERAAKEPAIQAAPAPGESTPQKSMPFRSPSSSGGPASSVVRPRKVERAASITLAAPRDEVESVADGVIRTADRYGGFVLNSNVSSGDRDVGATIGLRIPTSRLSSAIADISKLAHVKSRSQNALDITGRFSAPRRELADATAERRALLAQLARAVTANETASIRARLGLANDRISEAQATLRRLQNRVAYSSVSVTVEPGAKTASGGSWSVGDAFGDAARVLGVGAGVLVITLAVLIPLALLVALGWAARRAYLRHARNAALGAVEKPAAR